MNGIKITPADKWFSLCIRERAGWVCERCGVMSDSLQCAHVFGRGNKSVRLEPLNAFALCFTCHQYFTANPMHFSSFVHQKLGDKYELLNELSLDIVRGKEYVRAIKSGEAAAHYKKEFQRMNDEKLNGKTKVDFVGYV